MASIGCGSIVCQLMSQKVPQRFVPQRGSHCAAIQKAVTRTYAATTTVDNASTAFPTKRKSDHPKLRTPIRVPSPTREDPLFRFYNHSKRGGSDKSPRILVTGGMGQLGRGLADIIKYMYGRESVLLTDICKAPSDFYNCGGTSNFCYLNIMDMAAIEEVVVNHNIDTVVHLSALLSAVGEANVDRALRVNCDGVQNILNVAKTYQLKVFVPSTIGAFGPSTPRMATPDLTVQRPRTIYGVTKVFAELLGEYYHHRWGVDFRSLRFPGIISDVTPGGGTTDYAIEIFHDALSSGRHVCYLRPEARLPMMYGLDCMASIVGCLLAPSEALTLRTYNVSGFSTTPEELADEIRRYLPHFQIEYDICPTRQAIAESWPESLDDSRARADWQWAPDYDLGATVRTMLRLLVSKHATVTTAADSFCASEEPTQCVANA